MDCTSGSQLFTHVAREGSEGREAQSPDKNQHFGGWQQQGKGEKNSHTEESERLTGPPAPGLSKIKTGKAH